MEPQPENTDPMPTLPSLDTYQLQLRELEAQNHSNLMTIRRMHETETSPANPLYPNGMTVPQTSIIAQTFSSLLLHHGPAKTLKIPILENLSLYAESSTALKTARESNEVNTRLLEREKAVYLRLDGVEGVAKPLPGSPTDGILLASFPHGTLESRIASAAGSAAVGVEGKRRWVTEIISVLIRVHRAGVLARTDISLGNFAVVGDDGDGGGGRARGSVVMVGFAGSVVGFPGVDVRVVVDGGGRSGVGKMFPGLGVWFT